MLKINKIKIDIIDENNEKWGSYFEFSDKLTAFIGENTVGKSTIINSIYYALGMEELLGYRDAKALKPVLRDKIVINKGSSEKEKEILVKDSFIYLEIENIKKEKVVLKRVIKSSENISGAMISVFFGNLETIILSSQKDYFLNKDSAISEHGFFKFLENFLGLSLPYVLSYDENKKIKLYLQNIFSAFFIEQVGGWSDLLETTPKYYNIIHPKRRIIEFILGLSCNNIILKKIELSNKRKLKLEELKEAFREVEFLKRNSFIHLENFSVNYKNYNIKSIKIYIQVNNEELLPIDTYLTNLTNKLNDLKQQNYFNTSSSEEVNKLEEKIEDIQNKLIIYQRLSRESQEKIYDLKSQKESISIKQSKISMEIKNFKDIEKLNKLGSEQGIKIDSCPYCNNKLSETLYSSSIQVMSIKENLKYLDEKEKILSLAFSITVQELNAEEEKLKLFQEKIKILFEELNILNKDLPKISLQKDLFYLESSIEEEIKLLQEAKIELKKQFIKIDNIIYDIINIDSELNLLPKDNFTNDDKERLFKFEKSIIKNIKLFEITTNNFKQIKLSYDTYFPTIENFNIKLHISASDFIRLEWAYYISLVENSIFKNNILIFDEPAQQNIDIKSIKQLFEILKNIENTQSIISYAVSKENQKEMIEFFIKNKISYILVENASIEKIDL